jgi:hypothetical protein
MQISKVETEKNKARYSDQSERRSEEAMGHEFSKRGQIPSMGIKHSGSA